MIAVMQRKGRKINRGPAAAADNRAALLSAARKVFAERGYHAPLSAVAKEAGVGQGVLYRHFPTRLALAFAVFDENWAAYEALALDPDPQAFGRLWRRFIHDTIDAAAFVEMAVDARRSIPEYDGERRMRGLLEAPLARAKAAGLVDPALTIEVVVLAQRMAFGIVVTAVEMTGVRKQVAEALGLMRLVPPIE